MLGLDRKTIDGVKGFSLVELLLSMAITLIILAAAVAAFSGALSTRERETSRTDAITSTQAALSVMSREIGNAGYGLTTNGIVFADSGEKSIRFRANVSNNGSGQTDGPGEDVMYFYDDGSQSVLRYDRNTGVTSGVINRVSDVDFVFHNYNPNGSFTSGTVAGPTTGRVTIVLKVILADIQGQPTGRVETVRSDVTLRNSPYMLGQY
jgi:prepilin-type N-terminal cleavage/methylation domain-containing protein